MIPNLGDGPPVATFVNAGTVTGRIGVHDGARVIYNPRYDLRY